ncbi:MAG: hypothetical protein GX344_12870 [Intrasporangiaceae bacterium]|nr:hypothetical protein [Intrasporangiaceae bacterium]
MAYRDPVVGAAFVRVIAMLARPSELMHPRILTRVLAGSRRRPRTAAPAHTAPAQM